MALSLFVRLWTISALSMIVACGCSTVSPRADTVVAGDAAEQHAPYDDFDRRAPSRSLIAIEEAGGDAPLAACGSAYPSASSSFLPTMTSDTARNQCSDFNGTYCDFGNKAVGNNLGYSSTMPVAPRMYRESSLSPDFGLDSQFDSVSVGSTHPTATHPHFVASEGLFSQIRSDLWQDTKNNYAPDNLRDYSLGLALAAVMANTSLDGNFQNWYQRDIRSGGTDDFESCWKPFGEGQYIIPACAGLAVVGRCLDETCCGNAIENYGWRTTRAYLVGAPPMLLTQYTLGASRPGEHSRGSAWHPFQDNNSVSGHAFVGAVPLITAARMTENRWLKGGLYICSTFPAWSRVNDDAHYLSQAMLGWWMAYLTCRAVDRTEMISENVSVMPIAGPDIVGLSICHIR